MKVRYDGPNGFVNRDVGAEVGSDVLEYGAVYTLSDELAERLVGRDPVFEEGPDGGQIEVDPGVGGSPWWSAVDEGNPVDELAAMKRPELVALAASEGIEKADEYPNKRALAAAIVSARNQVTS